MMSQVRWKLIQVRLGRRARQGTCRLPEWLPFTVRSELIRMRLGMS